MSRNEIDCPRAKTWMTPCIARDGHLALSDSKPDGTGAVCIGCVHDARELLTDLASRYEPAHQHDEVTDSATCADALTALVPGYIETIKQP